MAHDDRQQITIGEATVAIAVVALVVAVLVIPGPTNPASVIARLFFPAILVYLLIRSVMTRQCPGCRRWTMARASLSSFRKRYYRCSSCGIRARRGLFGDWQDASAPEFDAIYARKRPENPWTAPPGVEDEDLVYSKTHVNLVLNKRRRNPNPPDQWTGRPDEPGTGEG